MNKVSYASLILSLLCSCVDNVTLREVNLDKVVKLSKPKAIALSTSKNINLEIGKTTSITILNGSGAYEVSSSNNNIATAKTKGNKLIIKGLKIGQNINITLTDKKTNKDTKLKISVIKTKTQQPKPIPNEKPKKLKVNVNNDINLTVGGQKTITITSGSGAYKVNTNDLSKVSATLRGNNINITAISDGATYISITDTKTKQQLSINIKIAKAESNTIEFYNENSFIEYQGEKEIRVYNTNSGDFEEKQKILLIKEAGNYDIKITKGDEFINAKINNKNQLIINTKESSNGVGEAILILTDKKTKKERKIKLRIIDPSVLRGMSGAKIEVTEGETSDIQPIATNQNTDHININIKDPKIASYKRQIKGDYHGFVIKGLKAGTTKIILWDGVTEEKREIIVKANTNK